MSRKLKVSCISAISSLFLIFCLSFSLLAQAKSTGDKVLIGGKQYTLYKTLSGETQFSIARKFGITVDELNRSNPEIKDKLNSGQVLKIPVAMVNNKLATANKLTGNDSVSKQFIYHSVRKKETVFSIAQKSRITSEDIYQFNPEARDGINTGDVLKIPKPQTTDNEAQATTRENQQPVKHVVGRKETLFSIARQYNTTTEEILKVNPNLKGVLSKGEILIIPGTVTPPINQNSAEPKKIIEYKIVNGDNFYQLEKRFGVSKSDLEQLNPGLKKDGFNAGMVIRLPVTEPSVSKMQASNKNARPGEPVSDVPFDSQNKLFEVGVFLPFCQNLSDSARIAQKTASFLEFYSGVLLATEKITLAGMKVKLNVFDTYQDNKVIEKLVKKPEFLSLDLIIGPVYPENQKIVTELSGKNHIPMISPLSSDSRFVATTPGYYQINPEKKLRIASTAEYIAGKFAEQNIIVINHGENSGDLKLIVERLDQKLGMGKFRQYNILDGGVAGLEAMLKTDKDNIIVLIEGSEANVSVEVTRLNTISKSNKITVIGIQEFTKMQSINIEYLHNIRLHYLSPYFIDYTKPAVKSFVEKYRAAYGGEPTQYSFQGFDIALHFLASLAMAGKDFPSTNPSPGIDLLQTEYSFRKVSDLGGYMNQTFYVIEYTDNYEVKSDGKVHGTLMGQL